MEHLSPTGHTFYKNLEKALRTRQDFFDNIETSERYHVVGVGKIITNAYERLRNVSENAEEHLLLQRAIRRFLRRLFLTLDSNDIANSGTELITELTMARYLQNDAIPTETIEKVSQLVLDHANARDRLKRQVRARKLETYTSDALSVEIAELLSPHFFTSAVTDLIYQYYMRSLDTRNLFGHVKPKDYDMALFVAIYASIFHADEAQIRHEYLKRFKVTPNSADFYKANKSIDKLIASHTTDVMRKAIDRQGAPFRILNNMLSSDEFDVLKLLANRTTFLTNYELEIANSYDKISTSINRGVVRSILFLLVTKTLLGVAVEAPFDIAISGQVILLPLLLNILFPPIYMLLLRFTILMPDQANTSALTSEIDKALFHVNGPVVLPRPQRFGIGYQLVYAAVFIGVFALVIWLLSMLNFNWLQVVIFFFFVSAASFLGFRLARTVREFEVIASRQNFGTVIRDFLYMPFVILGRWVSEKYAKINIVANVLDMFIELPLKTILHTIRQWGRFISNKKDDL
ncbi:MAG: hypothetical protein LBK50_01165 [Candidatus Nomurabacteria bacterium]|jgi:hypothetical protein|nr:hypothetical protein [Candidatus Nomurabacteria bacterium]